MSTVVATIRNPDQSYYTGTVRFNALTTPLAQGGAIVTGPSVSVQAGSLGAVSVTLATGRYKVTAGVQSWTIGVPDDALSYNMLVLITDGLSNYLVPAPSGGSKATSSYSGTVKTNSSVADPIVYLNTEVDALLAAAAVALETSMNAIAPYVYGIRVFNPTTNKYHLLQFTGTGDGMQLVWDRTGEDLPS